MNAQPHPLPVPRRKLHTLEAARGLAALAVLLFHSEVVASATHPSSAFASVFNLGFAGVDFFFLLSGFLMVWVHAPDFNRPQRLPAYLGRRFARVYPVYWVLCLALVPLTLATPMLRQNPAPISGAALAASLLLLPHSGGRLLGVTWTLEYELLFYLAFGLFFLSRRLGIGVFALWFAAIVCAALWGPPPLLPTGAPTVSSLLAGFLLNLHLAEFFAGMLLAHALRSGVRIPRPALLLAAGVALAFALQAFAFLRGNPALGWEQGHRLVTLAAGAIAAAILLGAVAWELRAGRLAIPPGLRTLGAASYSIYLTHFLAIAAVRVLVQRSARLAALPAWLQFTAILAFGLAPGFALHFFVEDPLLRLTCLARSRRVSNLSRARPENTLQPIDSKG